MRETVKKQKPQCLGCGVRWNQAKALDNHHRCRDMEVGAKTICPKCGWCALCDEKRE